MITVSVRLNGQLASAVGASRLQLSLPDHATVAHLVASVTEQYPAASDLAARAIPVVDGRHVPSATHLAGVGEVALLMPISGG